MKKIYILCLLIIFSTTAITLYAQGFNLIDVNKSTDSYPQNYQQAAAKNQFAVLDNIVSFFGASDGIHNGLWRSDGTAAGTFMIKDVYPTDIITSGEKLFFNANGNELWVSDGSKTGTKKISKISYEKGNNNPTCLTNVNGVVYFFTNYGNEPGAELWKTDGTYAGTILVKNFYNKNSGFAQSGTELTNVNGRLFFVMGYQLWTSDGTKEGTVQLTGLDLTSNYQILPYSLTAVNGKLYFGINDNTGADRLYSSDGTVAGTQPVLNAAKFDVYRQTNSNGDYIPFTVRNNAIFFAATSAAAGTELCKVSTAQSNRIEVVKDIAAGVDNSNPYNITTVDNNIYFNAIYGNDVALWKTDGTDAGTVLVKDINPGGTNWYTNFTPFKNKLFFSYYDDTNGFELWQSDGTEAGTNIVKDIYAGIYSCSSNNITYVNDFILFGANDGVQGQELWKSDGTTAGTFLLKDINVSSTTSSYPFTANGYNSYGLQGIVTPSDKLLFNATNIQYGNDELFISDGTAAGTHLVKDIDSGSNGSYPAHFANLKNETYFIAANSPDIKHQSGNQIYRLWKSNGTNAGTKLISIPGFDYENGYVDNMIATNNLLYIVSFNYDSYEYEIWRSDGTSAGSYLLQSLPTSYSVIMVPIGDTLFFNYYDNNTAKDELWLTLGTVDNTKLVSDKITNSTDYVAYNAKLYFTEAYYGGLWTSDGTKAGTQKIKNVTVDYNFPMMATKGKLFFYAGDSFYGYGDELWATDGTAQGTKMVKDINKGNNSSIYYAYYLNNLTAAIDSTLYFVAIDNTYLPQIWKSDGTANGTKPLMPNNYYYYYSFDWLTNANGRLYFLAEDSLWTSDGTEAGTVKINDANLANVYIDGNLIAAKNTLFFSAYTNAYGNELYAGSYSADTLENQNKNIAEAISVNNNAQFTLFPNPAKNILNIKINSANSNIASLSVVDVSGKAVLNKNISSIKGETIMQLDVSHLSSGTYFIKIFSADGTAKLAGKFIK